MKEVNLNFAFIGLDGNEMVDSNAGKLLANLLASDAGKNPIKFFSWAKEFYAGTTIKMDGQDIELLKTFVTDHNGISALAKAQVLEKLV